MISPASSSTATPKCPWMLAVRRVICQALATEISINPQTVAGRHEVRLISLETGRRRGEA